MKRSRLSLHRPIRTHSSKTSVSEMRKTLKDERWTVMKEVIVKILYGEKWWEHNVTLKIFTPLPQRTNVTEVPGLINHKQSAFFSAYLSTYHTTSALFLFYFIFLWEMVLFMISLLYEMAVLHLKQNRWVFVGFCVVNYNEWRSIIVRCFLYKFCQMFVSFSESDNINVFLSTLLVNWFFRSEVIKEKTKTNVFQLLV